ncbi:peptidoglycan-binding protein [Kitasatospora sp. NPDC057500]|uniref:peptidoglycan-binding domain-containing protein n=1 Tax=Kitasatospora sp. NPDC057500 TaxID=3346151 RepID=UPI00367FA87D
MPDQHCPTCGTARSAGCHCLVPDGSLDETAVLPHLEGPPLVRPYVPQAVGPIVENPPPGPRATDPFGTTVLPTPGPPPAGPPPGGPPVAPPAAPPLGPDADAYATTVLPPVASAPSFPPPPAAPAPAPAPAGNAPAGSAPASAPPADGGAEDELGVFPFAAAPATAALGGGRAARRAAEQQEARGPLARRKGLLIAAGAGLLAVTVGLAYAITPSSEPDDRAAPAPTATLGLAPVDPTAPAEPSPSAPPPAAETPTAEPTPTPARTSAKPSPPRTTAATPPPSAAPATTAAAAPPAPAPAPVPDPVTTPPPPAPAPATPAPTTAPPAPTATPTPDPAPTVRTLEPGMEGPDVVALQRKLGVVICWQKLPPTGKYDDRTESMVAYFQNINSIRGDARGVYGPNTRAALDNRTGC